MSIEGYEDRFHETARGGRAKTTVFIKPPGAVRLQRPFSSFRPGRKPTVLSKAKKGEPTLLYYKEPTVMTEGNNCIPPLPDIKLKKRIFALKLLIEK